MPSPLDQPGQRLERELEALLVDEPAHQQHQPLVRLGELRAQGVEVVDRHEVGRVDAVRDHRDALLVEPVDVGHVLAHVRRAGDHALGAVRHPLLDAVDVRLRVLVDPALVAAVLGGVDRDHERAAEALGEMVARDRDEPVVAVHDVERVAVAQLHPRGQHVGVHVLDPGHELAQLARAARLAHAVDHHALHLLLGGRLLQAAREHVHLHVLAHEVLGQLAHVAREAALDQRRVLPGEDQDAHQIPNSGETSSVGARLRRRGSATGRESARAASAASSRAACSSTRRARVVGREVVRHLERPVARLEREQLAGGPLRAPDRPPAGAGRGRDGAQLGAARGEGDVGHARRVPGREVLRLAPGRVRERPLHRLVALERVRERGEREPLEARLVDHEPQPVHALVPPVAEQLGVEREAGEPRPAALRPVGVEASDRALPRSRGRARRASFSAS